MIESATPDPEVLRKLYGDGPSKYDATLAMLRARRDHLDTLIHLLEAEMAFHNKQTSN